MTENKILNEQELLAKIAKGDHLAFKVVFCQYQDKVYNFAFKIMGDHQAAEEILQESMLYIWQRGHKLTAINNLEAYLKTIVKHKAIDAFRKAVLNHKVENDISEDYDDTFYLSEDDDLLVKGRLLLEQGIQNLPGQQKEVYKLCYQQGMKYEQVAQQLNISHGTVQTHMKLALKFLRTYIKNHPDMLALIVIFRLFEK